MKHLKELLKGIEIVKTIGDIEWEKSVENLTADSRKVAPGGVFIAVKGAVEDGSLYIEQAIKAGAKYIVTENINAAAHSPEAVFFIVKNSRRALSQIAINYYDNPSQKLKLVGVTGTNGKTSIATLLYEMFSALGHKCGLLSTIANYIDTEKYPTNNTTPGPIELNELLSRMVQAKCDYCFMEVSSHALSQDRVAGLEYAGGIFTNLTHDHLDYHKTFENYRDCKKKFFDSLTPCAFALANLDDRNGEYMVQNCKAKIKTYAIGRPADYLTKIMEHSVEGMCLNINGIEVWCNFIGAYNAENLTAIYAAAIELGAPQDEVVKVLSSLRSVAGRMECYRGGNHLTAAIDYAHTPDALENVLKTLQSLKPQGDIICVFGCGGDRDKTKRPEMGAIAGRYATKLYVTSDNPRREDPLAIIEDIKKGIPPKAQEVTQYIPDRVEAINRAIAEAKPYSIILIAGKGHEDYQIIGTVKHHLSDKETVLEVFKKIGAKL